jgi:hypothetical protein
LLGNVRHQTAIRLDKKKKVNLKKMCVMVLVLKKGASKKEIAAIEKKLYKDKASTGFNAKKYNAVMKLKEDPLVIQKQLRDEWE